MNRDSRIMLNVIYKTMIQSKFKTNYFTDRTVTTTHMVKPTQGYIFPPFCLVIPTL